MTRLTEKIRPSRPEIEERLDVLDGLRGIAVLMVMFLHFTTDGGGMEDPLIPLDRFYRWGANLGWIGVDLFFVLSGFLITRILLETKGSVSYFRTFYARRVLRIFPLYYAFLVLWLILVPLVHTFPEEYEGGNNSWACWLYLLNMIQAAQNSLEAGPVYTGHFWSLALEEQFYLAWPLVVYSLERRSLARACLLLLVVSPLFRLYLCMRGYGIASYVLTPARMDVLALGALLALTLQDRQTVSRMNGWLVPVAVVALAAFVAMHSLKLTPSFHSIWVTSLRHSAIGFFWSAVTLGALTASGGATVKILGNGFLSLCGRLSYALYIVHLPVAYLVERYVISVSSLPRFLESQLPAQAAFSVTATAASLLLAYLSWHLLEKNLLSLKKHFPYRYATPPAVEGQRPSAR